MTVIPTVIGILGTVTRGFVLIGNKRTSGNHPNYGIVEIGQSTKSPGDLRRLRFQWKTIS